MWQQVMTWLARHMRGRYVRMLGTVRGTQYGYSLWEMGVFTTSGGGGGNTVTVTNPGSQSSAVSQCADERDNEFLVSSNAEELGGNVLVVIASDTRQVRRIHHYLR